MADDNYPGIEGDAASSTDDSAPPTQDENKADTETALLPKSFFMSKDKQAGDRCEIEVVRNYEDEVEVKYVPHADKEEQDEAKNEPGTMERAHEDLGNMATDEESSGGY